MNREERINLLIGAALFVGGVAGMYLCMRSAERIERLSKRLDLEKMKQTTWNDISSMAFYVNATPEEQAQYYSAFWNAANKK